MMVKKYIVLVGDVVKSGKIPDRLRYWKLLRIVTGKINKKYKGKFYAPMVILKGDEISAVLKDLSSIYIIIKDLQELFYPYQMRFVGVYDKIDVALDTKNASLMDGPAFWKADKYLERLKREKKNIMFDLGNKTIDIMLTTIANLIAYMKSNWTEKELEIIHLYEKYGNQMKVAKECGISQQAVSNALKRAHWKIVRESEEKILKVLEKYVR